VLGSQIKVTQELAAATARAEALEKSVDELKDQLADLIKAKEDDETQLLEKFCDLLNEKKLKIRQQQRLLATANVDPDKLANLGASQNTERKAKASRSSKRKAKEEAPDESDDGFEMMDVDDHVDDEEPQLEPVDDLDTPSPDEEIQTESDESDEEPLPVSKPKEKSLPTRGTRSQDAKKPTVQKNDEPPPPRRNLPFDKRKAAKAATRKSAGVADDETDSEEEL
jgi:hypothetical protein